MHNLHIKYKSKVTLHIKLLDTPAVRKWVYCFLKNKPSNDMKATNVKWALNGNANSTLPSLKPSVSQKDKKDISIKINTAISNINRVIKGKKFPHWAKQEMNITETQLIHRSFTTGVTTLKAWKHNWDYKQLLQFKSMNWPEKRQAFIDLAPKQFEILDQTVFEENCHLINDLIHQYEPSIMLPRSIESASKKESADYLQVFFIKKGPKKHLNCLTLTEEELKQSFPGDYADYDVHIHSLIFGKSYRETYFEEDPPIEFDVTNVENISGEFSLFTPSKDKDEADYRRCVNNSDWSKWLDDTNIPFHLTRNPPLGKLVGWTNLKDNYDERTKQLTGEIEHVDVLWEDN